MSYKGSSTVSSASSSRSWVPRDVFDGAYSAALSSRSRFLSRALTKDEKRDLRAAIRSGYLAPSLAPVPGAGIGHAPSRNARPFSGRVSENVRMGPSPVRFVKSLGGGLPEGSLDDTLMTPPSSEPGVQSINSAISAGTLAVQKAEEKLRSVSDADFRFAFRRGMTAESHHVRLDWLRQCKLRFPSIPISRFVVAGVDKSSGRDHILVFDAVKFEKCFSCINVSFVSVLTEEHKQTFNPVDPDTLLDSDKSDVWPVSPPGDSDTNFVPSSDPVLYSRVMGTGGKKPGEMTAMEVRVRKEADRRMRKLESSFKKGVSTSSRYGPNVSYELGLPYN